MQKIKLNNCFRYILFNLDLVFDNRCNYNAKVNLILNYKFNFVLKQNWIIAVAVHEKIYFIN